MFKIKVKVGKIDGRLCPMVKKWYWWNWKYISSSHYIYSIDDHFTIDNFVLTDNYHDCLSRIRVYLGHNEISIDGESNKP